MVGTFESKMNKFGPFDDKQITSNRCKDQMSSVIRYGRVEPSVGVCEMQMCAINFRIGRPKMENERSTE